MAHALDVMAATQSDAPISDPVTGASGTGCQATVTGTGEQFASPDAVVKTLGSMLEEQGWTADPMLPAGGPNAIDEGYRKGDQICWAGAGWQPDDVRQLPEGPTGLGLPVTPAQQNYTVTLNCGVETSQGGCRHGGHGQSRLGELHRAGRHAVHRGTRGRRAVRRLQLRG